MYKTYVRYTGGRRHNVAGRNDKYHPATGCSTNTKFHHKPFYMQAEICCWTNRPPTPYPFTDSTNPVQRTDFKGIKWISADCCSGFLSNIF